jgi:tRNA(Arg) A34 adenosine deaminase TadA
MYVTLEPCMMCLSAINQSRISKVIYALPKQKEEKMNLTKKVIGDGEKEAYLLLNDFFKSKRK